MTYFHDYKRKIAATHAINGTDWEFKPNPVGDVVCDVTDDAVCERLLQIPEGFRPYGVQHEPISPLLTQPSGGIGTADDEKAKASNLTQQVVETGDNVSQVTHKDSDPYVLINGETAFDLKPLSDDALREFAKANDIVVHRAAKGNTIRDKIVEALKE